MDVYLPSENAKLEWEEEAKNAGLPMSSLSSQQWKHFEPQEMRLHGLIWKGNSLKSKKKLKSFERAQVKTLLLEKLEADVYKARYANIQEVEMDEGARRHDQELINILKRGKALEGYSILKELAIDPGETEAVKLVNNQLESLRRFGLVEENAKGWRWIK